jgi:hypothetical protein
MNFLKGLFSRSPKKTAATTKSRTQAKHAAAAKRDNGAGPAPAASPKKTAAPSKSRAQAKHSAPAMGDSGAGPALAARTKDAKTFGKAGHKKAAGKAS